MVRPPTTAAVGELNSDWLNCFTPNPGLRSRSPRLGNRNAQCIATAFYPWLGDRDWDGGDDLRFGRLRASADSLNCFFL